MPTISWSKVTPVGMSNVRAMAASSTTIVSVPDTGNTAYYSLDHGVTWGTSTLPSSGYWSSIAWNGSVFCAIRSGSTSLATSPDGITWTAYATGGGAAYKHICAKGSTLLAIVAGAGSSVQISVNNGATWSFSFEPADEFWGGIASDGSIYVLVGGANACYTSPDGTTWTSRTIPTVAGVWSGVVWNGSVFCAVSRDTSDIAATSPDGITWTQRTLPAATYWAGVTASTSLIVAYSQDFNARAAISEDNGETWDLQDLSPPSGGGEYKTTGVWSGVNFVLEGGGEVLYGVVIPDPPDSPFWTGLINCEASI